MGKPDLELEELDQRFSEVEKTIQSACEIMGKLKEASPKIEEIHQMSSEIHAIKEKAMQEIRPVKDRLEDLIDIHYKTGKTLESLKLELQKLKEEQVQISVGLSECVTWEVVSEVEKRLEMVSNNHSKSAKLLESLNRTLQENKEQTKKELAQYASLKRLSHLEEKLKVSSLNLEKRLAEQHEEVCDVVNRLSEFAENHDDRIKRIAEAVSISARNVKIALFLGAGALILSMALFFLGR